MKVKKAENNLFKFTRRSQQVLSSLAGIWMTSLFVLALTGYQAVRPFWIHLSWPVGFWSQSIRLLRFPVCQWVPGESHQTCQSARLRLVPSTRYLWLNLYAPLCFVLFASHCVCLVRWMRWCWPWSRPSVLQQLYRATRLRSSYVKPVPCTTCTSSASGSKVSLISSVTLWYFCAVSGSWSNMKHCSYSLLCSQVSTHPEQR